MNIWSHVADDSRLSVKDIYLYIKLDRAADRYTQQCNIDHLGQRAMG